MKNIIIRKSKEQDINAINKLLYEVHKVHSALGLICLKPEKTPIFVAEKNNEILGYVFCIYQQFINNNNMTDVKTLYIDDLCGQACKRTTYWKNVI